MDLVKKILVTLFLGFLVAIPSYGAVTYTIRSQAGPYAVGGYVKEAIGVLDLEGTYETGGFTLTAADFGFNQIQYASFQGNDYRLWFDSTSTIFAYTTIDETEMGDDLSYELVNFVIKGR